MQAANEGPGGARLDLPQNVTRGVYPPLVGYKGRHYGPLAMIGDPKKARGLILHRKT